jgi:hypothetical protein
VTEPTERQVLYGLVALGFHLVTAVLTTVAAVVGLSPSWWTVMVGLAWAGGAAWGVRNWQRTGRLLGLAVGLFVVWTIGTLLTR